uniref:Carboxylesterase type B domain-containing protein n=1 Tax=Acrobeloides nanus TaxID=290746 RepID=A0A914C8K2_9BILA
MLLILDLFQQGIFESGVLLLDGYSGYGNISFIYAYLLCNSTLEEWESNNFTELTNCLKPMNSSYFLSLEDVTNDWLVVVDGYFLPDFPANLWRQRPNIPIMIGHNRDETSFYDLQDFVYGQENFTSFTKDLVIAKITPLGEMGDGNSSEILEVIESVYFPPDTLENDHLTWLKVSEKILTSAAVTRFNAKFIDEYFRNGNENIFIYELAHAPKFRFKILEEISGWDPVPHGVDVEFLWMKGPWDSWISSDWILHDLALVELFGEAWTNFAKYSAPLGKNWKPANSTNWQYYQMGQYCGKMLQNYGQTDNIVWNQVLSALNAYTGTSYDLL